MKQLLLLMFILRESSHWWGLVGTAGALSISNRTWYLKTEPILVWPRAWGWSVKRGLEKAALKVGGCSSIIWSVSGVYILITSCRGSGINLFVRPVTITWNSATFHYAPWCSLTVTQPYVSCVSLTTIQRHCLVLAILCPVPAHLCLT